MTGPELARRYWEIRSEMAEKYGLTQAGDLDGVPYVIRKVLEDSLEILTDELRPAMRAEVLDSLEREEKEQAEAAGRIDDFVERFERARS